jgi:peptide/nickel transport system substrate-binding protein
MTIWRRIALIVLAAGLAAPAAAKPFRLATTVDASTLDPHANNALHTTLLLTQVYEPLVRRDDELRLIPGLALSWSQPEPTRWRFLLRPDVRFAEGEPFTAEDAAFSVLRATAPTSNFTIYVDTVAQAVAAGPLTLDIVTRVPDAALPEKLTRVLMMSRSWSEANGSARPQDFRNREDIAAARRTNGTGPFVIAERNTDQRTIMRRQPGWWGGAPGPDGVTEYQHIIIASDATRVAALLSGEVDMLHTVPAQAVERLRATPSIVLLTGLENRTVMLGFDHQRETLANGEANPLRDLRVRRAIELAIDADAIATRSMRGQAEVTGAMWTRYVNGWAPAMEARPALDRAAARGLLAEAGYPGGFATSLDCAVGPYEAACTAIPPMLAQVGIRVSLQIVPAAQYSLRLQRRETALHMLAWGVPTFDALYTLRALMVSREMGGAGSWNVGGYGNPRVDAAVRAIEVEPDADRRRALIAEAHGLHRADLGHVPLFHQTLNWAVRRGVTVAHRADNLVEVRTVTVE